MLLVRPMIKPIVGEGSFQEGPWRYRILSVLMVTPMCVRPRRPRPPPLARALLPFLCSGRRRRSLGGGGGALGLQLLAHPVASGHGRGPPPLLQAGGAPHVGTVPPGVAFCQEGISGAIAGPPAAGAPAGGACASGWRNNYFPGITARHTAKAYLMRAGLMRLRRCRSATVRAIRRSPPPTGHVRRRQH